MIEIICAALGSGTLVTLIQFLFKRYDEKKGKLNTLVIKIDTVQKGLSDLSGELDKRDALEARRHILSASDDIRHGKQHSKEYFDQLNEDIDAYTRYCDEHKDFKNNKCVKAIEVVNKVYARCLETGDFDE